MDNKLELEQQNRQSINSFQEVLQDILKEQKDRSDIKDLIFSSKYIILYQGDLPLVDQLINELSKPVTMNKKKLVQDDKPERNVAVLILYIEN